MGRTKQQKTTGNSTLDEAIKEYAPFSVPAESPATNPPTTTNSNGNPVSSGNGGIIFDYSQYLPGDLLSDSSPLPAKDEATAQKELASIEGKRRTVAVIRANLGLATDLREADGDFIDYQLVGAKNDIKLQNLETKKVELKGAKIQTQIAGVKNASLRLELQGSTNELNLDASAWKMKLQAKRDKLSLAESKIKQLREQAKVEAPDIEFSDVSFNPTVALAAEFVK